MRLYTKSTGNNLLKEGTWLRKDRKHNTKRWHEANINNLKSAKGFDQYTTIRQRRDFYKWFYTLSIKKGHDLSWIGAAIMVTKRLAMTDSKIMRMMLFRDKDLVRFFNVVNRDIFNYAFLQFQDVYNSKNILVGAQAARWDSTIQYDEQYLVAQPIYEKQSRQTLKKYQRMAEGKGLYRFGANKHIRFEGRVDNPADRFYHGMMKVMPFYKKYKK